VAGDVPDQYMKDFQYLKGLSEKGALRAGNSIYKSLDQKAKNLPSCAERSTPWLAASATYVRRPSSRRQRADRAFYPREATSKGGFAVRQGPRGLVRCNVGVVAARLSKGRANGFAASV
jgi:hypothetical protein